MTTNYHLSLFYIHTYSLYLTLSYLSFTHTQTITHYISFTYTHYLSRTLTISHSFSLLLFFAIPIVYSHLTLSLSYSHTHTLTLFFLSLSPSPSLSISLLLDWDEIECESLKKIVRLNRNGSESNLETMFWKYSDDNIALLINFWAYVMGYFWPPCTLPRQMNKIAKIRLNLSISTHCIRTCHLYLFLLLSFSLPL